MVVAIRNAHEELTNTPDSFPSIPDYEIESVIARGGMGIVYQARQLQANRVVALKMTLGGRFASEEERARFQHEAELAAQLTHQAIVPIFDLGTFHGQPYYSMGYVGRASLREILAKGPLSNRDAAELVARLTQAIAYAHEQGIVHRDLKPANILMDENGLPYVTDFGLAKHLESAQQLTSTGQIVGTPNYMSPEQASGRTSDVGSQSDIYSLGALLYVVLTGRPPFQAASPMDTVMQVIHSDPVPPRTLNPAIDKDLDTICLKCLEKLPSRRYSSAAELERELTRYLGGEPILARPVSSLERLWRWCKRKPGIASLTAGIALSLITGASVAGYFAVLANERAEKATTRTRVALASLETIIYTVQSKLRDIPGAGPIRRELLTSTLSELEKILDEADFQSQIDRDTANIHVDIGLLYLELGDEGGGNAFPQAETHLRRAVEIFEQLSRTEEYSDPLLQRDHSRAWNQLGNALHQMDRFQESERAIRQGLAIRLRLIERNPGDRKIREYLSRSWHSLSCTLAYRGKHKQAMQPALKALDLALELEQAEPTNAEYVMQVIRCYNEVGDHAHDLKDNATALTYFNGSLEFAQKYAERFPVSSHTHDNLSYCYECLGNHWRQVGEPEKALGYFQKMLEELELASGIDPGNRFYKEGMAVAYDKLFCMHRILGHADLAKSYRKKRDEMDAWLALPRE